jgi:hypothetical protein
MIDSIPRPDASLPELLAARARHASDGRLALDATGGFIFVLLAALWRGPGWHLILSIAACFLAFGVWGIADRELGERSGSASRSALQLLRGARVIAIVVGALAFATLMVSALAIALGRMIS